MLSAGSGEPRNKVGVALAEGVCGVVSAKDCVQALSARVSNRKVKIFLFIVFPSVVHILAFFKRDCKHLMNFDIYNR